MRSHEDTPVTPREVPPAELTVPEVTGVNTPFADPESEGSPVPVPSEPAQGGQAYLRGGLDTAALAAVEADMWGDDPRLALPVASGAHPTKERPRVIDEHITQYELPNAPGLVTVNGSVMSPADTEWAAQLLEQELPSQWEPAPLRPLVQAIPESSAEYNQTQWVSPGPARPFVAKVVEHKTTRASRATEEMAIGNRIAEACASPPGREVAAGYGFSELKAFPPVAALQTEEEVPAADAQSGVAYTEYTEVLLYERPQGRVPEAAEGLVLDAMVADLTDVFLVNGLMPRYFYGLGMQIAQDTAELVNTGAFELLPADYSSFYPGSILYRSEAEGGSRVTSMDAFHREQRFTVEGEMAIAQAPHEAGQDFLLEVSEVDGAVALLHNPRNGLSAVLRFNNRTMEAPRPMIEDLFEAIPELKSPATLATVVTNYTVSADEEFGAVLPPSERIHFVLSDVGGLQGTARTVEHDARMHVALNTGTGEVVVNSDAGMVYRHTPPQPVRPRTQDRGQEYRY